MRFVIYALAVWRVSKLLVKEDGPYYVFRHLREATGIEYNSADEPISWPDWNPLTCICCTSIYVALALAKAPTSILNPLAASALAIFADKLYEVE